MTSAASKSDWNLKKKMMQTLLECGGTIFGGAVRDSYIHDFYAEAFYDHVSTAINAGGSESAALRPFLSCATLAAWDTGGTLYKTRLYDELHNHPDFLPEFKGRNVIPKDLDVWIHADDLERAIEQLGKCHRLHARRIFTRDPCQYFPNMNAEPGSLSHVRVAFYPFHPHIKHTLAAACHRLLPSTRISPELEQAIKDLALRAQAEAATHARISVDFIVELGPRGKGPRPPFSDLDFECNGLFLTSGGYQLCPSLAASAICSGGFKRLQDQLTMVLDDIIHFRARIDHSSPRSTPIYRIQKMLRKGFTITGFFGWVPVPAAASAEMCIICHEELGPEHYKMKCCSAKFHDRCLRDTCFKGAATSLVHTERCILCRRDLLYVRKDAEILEAILSPAAPRIFASPPLPLAPAPPAARRESSEWP